MAGTTTDKLERLMQTKADIKSALIEKGQSPGDVFSEYANMVRAISGGSSGGGGDGSAFVINGPEVSIASEVSVIVEEYKVYTHALYNGVRLPVIPEDVLASYPYAWIRKNTTSGYYDLLMSNLPFYYQVSQGVWEGNGRSGTPWYRVAIATAETATAWTDNTSANTFNYFGIDSARPVLWANHDIPYGSSYGTDIYFEGTDPVPTD